MHVVIFEGSRWPTFAPLSLSRPVFMLATGTGTLLEKQVRYLAPTKLTLWVRPGLVEYCRRHVVPRLQVPTTINEPLGEEPALLVSGRTLHFGKYEYPPHPAVVLDESNTISSALVQSPGLSPDDVMRRTDEWLRTLDLPQMMSQSRLASYLWDLLNWNEESLVDDSVNLRGTLRLAGPPAGRYHLAHEDDVLLADDVTLGPGCVLDATKGPVMLAAGVNVGANAVLQGPCWIGPGTQVSPMAVIKGGVSVGPLCKVGGEISNSIIQGHTNKAHDGYLGDSYLGEWVNLGAGTVTSNLKNTYGQITMRLGRDEVPTGRRFLGSIVGDHSKTAVGTRLMTGTYVGYCCMLAGSAHPPKMVPSFTFLTDKGAEKYRPDKAEQVMSNVFARRSRQWAEADAEMMRYVAATAREVEGD